MNVMIATDFGIVKKGDRYYAKTALSTIMRRYYGQMGKLNLCLPLRGASKMVPGMEDITEMVGKVIPLGKLDALLGRKRKLLMQQMQNVDLVVVRCASFAAIEAAKAARACGKPVLAEVMSCAWDGMWNHSLKGKLIAPYFFLATKKLIRKADFALYVTQRFLQERYPCPGKSIGASNVKLSGDRVDPALRHAKIAAMDKKNITLMTCAAVNVRFKGQQYVIKAIPMLNRMGIRVKYYCVGQGDQSYLKKVAAKYGVSDQVELTGPVPHEKIFELLDGCDIYVQPSLQEGLPRSVVEAMSRGCPCVGARTAGIPELLPEDCLADRKSASDIAACIGHMLDAGLDDYAEKAFARAADFETEILDARRNGFFAEVKEVLSY